MIVKETLYLQRIIVWWVLWSGGNRRLFLIKTGNTLTVYSGRFRNKITQTFVPQWENNVREHIWSKQNSVNCHTIRETLTVCMNFFLVMSSSILVTSIGSHNNAISTYVSVGILQSQAYANKPTTHLCKTVNARMLPKLFNK